MRWSDACRAASMCSPRIPRGSCVSRAARPAPIALVLPETIEACSDGRRLEFGWFLPTAGDTTAYGLASAQVAPSLALFDKVSAAAEAAGFEYMLVPVQTACWEAWISSADDGGALQVDPHAGGGAAELHQSRAAGEDDRGLRPALGRPHLHQPDRRARARPRTPPKASSGARKSATRSWTRRSRS